MSLKDKGALQETRFMASCDSYEDALAIIVGAPMDLTSSFKPGSRFGPQRIREVSFGLEEYSVYIDKDLKDSRFFDCGDLVLPAGCVRQNLDIIMEAAHEITSDGKFPLFVGGEHLISVPVIKCMYDRHGKDLVLLHFDAHADLRDDYLGVKESHASTIRRVIDFMPGKNIFQFGIRSATREELMFAKQNTNLFMFEVLRPLKEIIKQLEGRPVYTTIDIDVVDPAYANGTGTPEPGGITSCELLQAIHLLSSLNLLGADIVEVSPTYDYSDRTSLLAAKIIREILLIAC